MCRGKQVIWWTADFSSRIHAVRSPGCPAHQAGSCIHMGINFFSWLFFFQGVCHPSFFFHDIHSLSLIFVQLLLTFIFEKCSCVFQSQNKEGNLRQVTRVRRKLPGVHILHFLLDLFTLCESLSHGHFIRLVSMCVYQKQTHRQASHPAQKFSECIWFRMSEIPLTLISLKEAKEQNKTITTTKHTPPPLGHLDTKPVWDISIHELPGVGSVFGYHPKRLVAFTSGHLPVGAHAHQELRSACPSAA